MKVDNLEVKRYLENLGFFFDEENNYWYHYGDITIASNFNVPVNIFVEGCLTIQGFCITNDLTVTEILHVHEYLTCDELSASYIEVKEDLICKDITVNCDMNVGNNVDAENIIVYGKLAVSGILDAYSAKAYTFDLKHKIKCWHCLKSI